MILGNPADLQSAAIAARRLTRILHLLQSGFARATELTAALLNNMIDKIVVHEAIKYENGFREQKIEIYYRFVGKID